jgi:subtilisin family serine protease
LKKTIGGGTKALRNLLDLDKSSTLSRGKKSSMLELKLKPGADVLAAVALLNKTAGVEWAAPNYVYHGPDPRELTPNDPSYASQWFHTKMQNHLAWDTTQGEDVVVAITDDGTDWDHVDLADNIWSNGDELGGNGLDDDLNGFIDDVRGWDFVSNDNNPDHAGTDNHGTHVAGIIAARTNNAVGIAGTAGRVQLMPIRFYGSTAAWTSTLVFNSFKYAIDNGAKIVSTSYNVDGFVGDPTYVAAINYIYNAGGLHFNSAGNTSTLNPARQVYDQTLYIAATNSSDARSSFSNYGTGIDIAAPGEAIYSTLPNNTYGSQSGTSMATPNAAASAALVWAAHPTWTRDQVAAQLLGVADNIDGINPSYATLLGTGRVNSFKGVTNTLGAPKFRGVTGLPADNAVTTAAPTAITFDLFNVLEPSAMNTAGNFELRSDGADDVFGTGDDAVIPLALATTYRIGTNKFNLTVGGGSLSTERYRFRAVSGAGALRDPFGNPLDGNGDGTGGDAFTRTFTIVPKSAARVVNVTINTTTPDVTFGDFPTVFTGTAGPNAFVLSGDGGGNVDIWFDQDPQLTPQPTYTIARSRLTTLNFDAGGGDDSLLLDYSNGNPIPSGGVTLDGGAGSNDILAVRGTSGDDAFTLGATSIARSGNAAATRTAMEMVTFSGFGGNDDVALTGAGTAVNFPAAQRIASLNVGADSIARVTPGGVQALVVNALIVDGTLDLADNDLVIDYTGASVLGTSNGLSYTDVTGQIASGAIHSSFATPGLTTLGVAEAAAVLGLPPAATATWSAVTVDASSVLIKYTYTGDANLDGLVSGDDYTLIDFAIAVPGSSLWQNGDFNLDGLISGDDYTAIDFAIAAQGLPL